MSLRCPYDQAELISQPLDGVEVDICPTCGGHWLDMGEIEALQKAHDHDHDGERIRLNDDVGMAFERARQARRATAACPHCDSGMVREEYGYASGVLVDSCPNGHGHWLESGELEALEMHFEQMHREFRAEGRFVSFLRGLVQGVGK